MAAIQLIWNYTDPTSFYPHLAVNPLPNSPVSHVIIAPAQGDHQVAPVTIEVLARSQLGIQVMQPYARSRSIPLVDEIDYPHQGSVIVNWDYNAPFAVIGNRIPNEDQLDPHDLPRKDEQHNRQMIHFWKTGEVIDVCDGQVCGKRD